jgi:hypothetical protein
VVDIEGNQWDLEGTLRPEISGSTPKKVKDAFAKGFPQAAAKWTSSMSQARKAAHLVNELKVCMNHFRVFAIPLTVASECVLVGSPVCWDRVQRYQ